MLLASKNSMKRGSESKLGDGIPKRRYTGIDEQRSCASLDVAQLLYVFLAVAAGLPLLLDAFRPIKCCNSSDERMLVWQSIYVLNCRNTTIW